MRTFVTDRRTDIVWVGDDEIVEIDGQCWIHKDSRRVLKRAGKLVKVKFIISKIYLETNYIPPLGLKKVVLWNVTE